MGDEARTNDISRLYEALGLDPASYVSFARRPIRAKRTCAPNSGWAVGRGSEKVAGIESGRGSEPLSPESDSHHGIHAGWRPAREHAVRPMQVLMLSPTGGSGKTTLAAALAQVLRERRHSVLLADHSLCSTMQALFALSADAHSGMSFGSGVRNWAPLPILSRFYEGHPIQDFDEWFERLAAGTEFTFVDGLADAAGHGRSLIERGGRIIVPVLPDVVSGMSVVNLDKALSSPWPGRTMYVLNRFDENQALHRDVRVWLRENLGVRLLPFEIPEDPALHLVAKGAAIFRDMEPYAPTRLALESLVELLEKCGAQDRGEAGR